MRIVLSLFLPAILTLANARDLALGPSVVPETCLNAHVVSHEYVGKDKNVLVEALQCAHPGLAPKAAPAKGLVARQDPNNVCGAPCTTNCFTPSGGGPDPNECHVIADALLFDSQNVGALFPIGPANNASANVITMTYRSCKTFMVNQVNSTLTYCRTAWSELVDFVAFNCQATQNAHGGNCVASDQRWFVQVQHS